MNVLLRCGWTTLPWRADSSSLANSRLTPTSLEGRHHCHQTAKNDHLDCEEFKTLTAHRAALEAQRKQGARKKKVCFTVDDQVTPLFMTRKLEKMKVKVFDLKQPGVLAEVGGDPIMPSWF